MKGKAPPETGKRGTHRDPKDGWEGNTTQKSKWESTTTHKERAVKHHHPLLCGGVVSLHLLLPEKINVPTHVVFFLLLGGCRSALLQEVVPRTLSLVVSPPVTFRAELLLPPKGNLVELLT